MKACLFDMDGLLIDTEDMYTIATNNVLAKYNKGPLPWSIKVHLQGRPGQSSARVLLDWAKLPLTVDELLAQTNKEQAKLWPKTKLMPGAHELLQFLSDNKIPVALATSSTTEKYHMKADHLQKAFKLFGRHIVTGDDPRIPDGHGKPDPDIYLVALESINEDRRAANLPDIKPEECLVFEDGVAGVEAGQAAGMTVIWVPHPELVKFYGQEKIKEIISKGKGEIVSSLNDFNKLKYKL